MLVLRREIGASILIGPECEIELLVSDIRLGQAELCARYRNTAGRISGELHRGKYSRDEVLKLGNDILCIVLAVKDQKVTLGLSAPANYQIHRREMWERIHPNK